MEKYVIAMEETIVQEFEINADSAEEAMQLAEERYRNGKYILESGEVQFRQMSIVKPIAESTEWMDF